MFNNFHKKIKSEALAGYPYECVWLITASGCRQVRNISKTPTDNFQVSTQDIAAALDDTLLCVIHSHPDAPACPSEADMTAQMQFGVPFGIVSTDGINCSDPVFWGGDTPVPDLYNRGFCHGITDCYGLIRDYYRVEQNITLNEHPRSWEWWQDGGNLYLDNVDNDGWIYFDPLEERPKVGDMFFAQIRSKVPNHAGVLIDDGLILHHLTASHAVDPTRIPRREPVNRWRSYITHWFRHGDMK